MWKPSLLSLKDNFKQRATNPFLGTYILVWAIRNWKLLYTVFNFDKNTTLDGKVKFISEYYGKGDFLLNLWQNVYISFIVLTITYVLIAVSRFIIDFFEKRITPWIARFNDKSSIVLKTTYLELLSERDELEEKIAKERESKSKLESKIKNLEDDVVEARKATETQMVKELKDKIQEAERKHENLQTTKQALELRLNNLEQHVGRPGTLIINPLQEIYNQLNEDKLIDEFKHIARDIRLGREINRGNQYVSKFKELDLIRTTSKGDAIKVPYELTNYGKELVKIIEDIEEVQKADFPHTV